MSMPIRQFFPQTLQSGQALLIIVLVMVVALTIGLSVATRSLVNTRISTEEESSQRAFSAAEAGIERLLETSATSLPNVSIGENTTYTATVVSGNANQFVLNGGNPVVKGDGVDLWLSNYPGYTSPWSGTITLYWGQSDSCSTSPPTAAAIEVVLLHGASTASPKATHYVFDPCTGVGGRQDTNNFTAATSGNQTVAGVSFTRNAQITIPAAEPGFVARIIPLYNSSVMAVSATSALPTQGRQIESTGNSGGTARKISVYQSNPKLPIELFPYTIFAPNN